MCGEWPQATHHIADLQETRVALEDDQFFAGWTILALKRHAVELYELEASERARVMEDVNAVAQALAHVFQPRKINYAFFGNRVPHMHWHIIPRLSDDPAPLETPWGVPHTPAPLGPAARADRIARIRARLLSA